MQFFSLLGSNTTKHSGMRLRIRSPSQVAVHLPMLAVQGGLHLLAVCIQLLAAANPLHLFQPRQSAADGAEIGQRATEPALGNERM